MQVDESEILEQLRRLEPLFHAACAEADAARFEALVAPEFWEIGASGRVYTREFALAVLRERRVQPYAHWLAEDYAATFVAPGLCLLRYRLIEPNRVTLRTTLWRRDADGWRALFHQGTVVGDSPWTQPAAPAETPGDNTRS